MSIRVANQRIGPGPSFYWIADVDATLTVTAGGRTIGTAAQHFDGMQILPQGSGTAMFTVGGLLYPTVISCWGTNPPNHPPKCWYNIADNSPRTHE